MCFTNKQKLAFQCWFTSKLSEPEEITDSLKTQFPHQYKLLWGFDYCGYMLLHLSQWVIRKYKLKQHDITTYSLNVKCKAQKRPSQQLFGTNSQLLPGTADLSIMYKDCTVQTTHISCDQASSTRITLTKSHAQACSRSTIHMNLWDNRWYIYWSVILDSCTELLKPLEFPSDKSSRASCVLMRPSGWLLDDFWMGTVYQKVIVVV